MKCRWSLFIALLIVSLPAAAQTATGYCMKYDKQHWVYQKDGQVNVIDIDMEWPMEAFGADISQVQAAMGKTAFGIEERNYHKALQQFLQRFGAPVTKPFETMPDDSAFCYVKVSTALIGYQPGRYISLWALYDCAPLPRSSQAKEHRAQFITFDFAKGKMLTTKDIVDHSELDKYGTNTSLLLLEDRKETAAIIVKSAGLGQGAIHIADDKDTQFEIKWALARSFATHNARKLMEKKAETNRPTTDCTTNKTFYDKDVCDKPDQPAVFSFDGKGIKDYLTRHLQLPDVSPEYNIGNQLVVSAIIDQQGHVTDVAVTDPCSPAIDREVVRVVKALPQWTPATLNGQNVNSRVNLPIEFK